MWSRPLTSTARSMPNGKLSGVSSIGCDTHLPRGVGHVAQPRRRGRAGVGDVGGVVRPHLHARLAAVVRHQVAPVALRIFAFVHDHAVEEPRHMTTAVRPDAEARVVTRVARPRVEEQLFPAVVLDPGVGGCAVVVTVVAAAGQALVAIAVLVGIGARVGAAGAPATVAAAAGPGPGRAAGATALGAAVITAADHAYCQERHTQYRQAPSHIPCRTPTETKSRRRDGVANVLSRERVSSIEDGWDRRRRGCGAQEEAQAHGQGHQAARFRARRLLQVHHLPRTSVPSGGRAAKRASHDVREPASCEGDHGWRCRRGRRVALQP
jgi:hypothetical protein